MTSQSKDEAGDDVEAISFVPSAERREATEKAPVFLSKSPMETLKETPAGNVPWIIGFNSWEGYVFTHKKRKQIATTQTIKSLQIHDMSFRRLGSNANSICDFPVKPELLNLKSPEEVKSELHRTGPSRFQYSRYSNKDEVSNKLHEFYFGDRTDVRVNLTTLITDFKFLHCSVVAAQLYAEKGPVYFFEFEEAGGFSLVSFLLGGDQPPGN